MTTLTNTIDLHHNRSMAMLASQHPEILDDLSDEELLKLEYDWSFWARPDQLEPDEFIAQEYILWLVLAGRGYGKTRVGAETTNKRVRESRAGRIGLIAPSVADCRDVMVEGESGIIPTSPPWDRPKYISSRRRVEWPNGAVAFLYSAEDPDQLRGPQHDWVWMDELAAWPRQTMQDTYDNAMFGLRKGAAQYLVTTTPRPIEILRQLVKKSSTYITKGSTYDNLHNLSNTYRQTVVEQYEGTRLGRQELYAEILDDVPGAIWTWPMIENFRITDEKLPALKRIGIGVDPAGSRDGHEVGIVVGGIAYDDQGYLLADRSIRATPDVWGNAVLDAFDEFDADVIILENNFGAEMVAGVIRNIRPNAPIIEVRASRGKSIRAQPVSLLNERGLIHHVGDAGKFYVLESQLTQWLPEDGPNDRMDAYVWLWTNLMSGRVRGKVWVP